MNEGVRLKRKKFFFDYNKDKPGDVINLQFANTKSKIKRFGLQVYSGWVLNPDSDPATTQLFRKELKADSSTFISPQDKEQLIKKAVIGFDHAYGAASYDVIIYPKSTSSLAQLLASAIHDKAGQNTILANEAIVKNKIENITIDVDEYIRTAKTPEEAAKRRKAIDTQFKSATKTGTFQLKKIHSFVRKVFSNFLIFQDDTSRQIYNAINGGKVLLVDDYLTTGSTLLEMVKLLDKYDPDTITYCVLIR